MVDTFTRNCINMVQFRNFVKMKKVMKDMFSIGNIFICKNRAKTPIMSIHTIVLDPGWDGGS